MSDLVFLIRQSPDWAALAVDYEAGRRIDIDRYVPRHDIPGFPRRIDGWIERWNRLFGLNFFRCRQILKDIAFGTVAAIADALVLEEHEYPGRAAEIEGRPGLLFYMDDDDWFAPDIRERLTGLDLGTIDIAVFPLVRLGQAIQTFVRADANAPVVIGTRKDFDFRFQTNNYAIRTDRVSGVHIPHLKDHVLASAYADRQGFQDAYFDRIISATNKTPCSASGLPRVLKSANQAIDTMRRYAETLKTTPLPTSEHWLQNAMAPTIALFERLARSARSDVHFGIAETLKLRFARMDRG